MNLSLWFFINATLDDFLIVLESPYAFHSFLQAISTVGNFKIMGSCQACVQKTFKHRRLFTFTCQRPNSFKQ